MIASIVCGSSMSALFTTLDDLLRFLELPTLTRPRLSLTLCSEPRMTGTELPGNSALVTFFYYQTRFLSVSCLLLSLTLLTLAGELASVSFVRILNSVVKDVLYMSF